ncbi:MarC family protein [Prosthecobacter sp.]|uniref:MarC family protein n=1 Tax=Prosthecobacter sp. TaxID=1965333 RepID=UPI002ABA67F9|nr:MarC family protein [Prosthecobacter sp.]MDZ4405996.1 MarC family protein [Prosthecobacter sp.]
MDTLSATLLLLTIMDPLGNVATFVSGLRPVPPERRLRVIARELVIALVILVVFLFAGPWLLGLLHLKQEALFISGGIVLFLIALKMIFPPSRHESDEPQIEPFIVPLATPMIAGPSVLATLLVLVSTQPEQLWRWFAALLIAWSITAAVLLSAPAIARVLKDKGSLAVERLMGMLLVMVAVQMFLNGIEHYLKH